MLTNLQLMDQDEEKNRRRCWSRFSCDLSTETVWLLFHTRYWMKRVLIYTIYSLTTGYTVSTNGKWKINTNSLFWKRKIQIIFHSWNHVKNQATSKSNDQKNQMNYSTITKMQQNRTYFSRKMLQIKIL